MTPIKWIIWLISMTCAYIYAGHVYGRVSVLESPNTNTLILFAFLLIPINLMFYLSYLIGPSFLATWFVSSGIGYVVGYLRARSLGQMPSAYEIVALVMILVGGFILTFKTS